MKNMLQTVEVVRGKELFTVCLGLSYVQLCHSPLSLLFNFSFSVPLFYPLGLLYITFFKYVMEEC